MLTGEMADDAGVRRKVCITTREQKEQLIAVATAAVMWISLAKRSSAIRPAGELRIPVTIRRDSTEASPVQVDLVVPRRMREIAAEPVMGPPESAQATLVVTLGPAPGPLNMPLVVRATASGPQIQSWRKSRLSWCSRSVVSGDGRDVWQHVVHNRATGGALEPISSAPRVGCGGDTA